VDAKKLIPEKDKKKGPVALTADQAERLYEYDMTNAIGDARAFLRQTLEDGTTVDRFEQLSNSQKVAVLDISFNLGRDTLFEFQGFRSAIWAGNWNEAALHLKYVDPTDPSKGFTPRYQQIGQRTEREMVMLSCAQHSLAPQAFNIFVSNYGNEVHLQSGFATGAVYGTLNITGSMNFLTGIVTRTMTGTMFVDIYEQHYTISDFVLVDYDEEGNEIWDWVTRPFDVGFRQRVFGVSGTPSLASGSTAGEGGVVDNLGVNVTNGIVSGSFEAWGPYGFFGGFTFSG